MEIFQRIRKHTAYTNLLHSPYGDYTNPICNLHAEFTLCVTSLKLRLSLAWSSVSSLLSSWKTSQSLIARSSASSSYQIEGLHSWLFSTCHLTIILAWSVRTQLAPRMIKGRWSQARTHSGSSFWNLGCDSWEHIQWRKTPHSCWITT